MNDGSRPAAQPFGGQDMLARLLMGNPEPGLPGPVVAQSAEGRPIWGMHYHGPEFQARLAALLRGELQLDPNGVTSAAMMRRPFGNGQ